MTPEPGIKRVDAGRIADLAREAASKPRKRDHLLFHIEPADPVQRLLIVLQPGTYVRPHQHSEQWELLILLKGRAEMLIFSDAGSLESRIEFSGAGPMAEIPPRTWHGVVVREPATALVEIKPGPYRPNEFADWAPEESAPEVPRFVDWALSADIGASWSRREA